MTNVLLLDIDMRRVVCYYVIVAGGRGGTVTGKPSWNDVSPECRRTPQSTLIIEYFGMGAM